MISNAKTVALVLKWTPLHATRALTWKTTTSTIPSALFSPIYNPYSAALESLHARIIAHIRAGYFSRNVLAGLDNSCWAHHVLTPSPPTRL